MMCRIYVIFAFVAFCELFCGGLAAEICKKLDFNRDSVHGLRECKQEFLPMYSVKRYEETPSIRPFRENTEYFLSNYLEGHACAETFDRFELNSASSIEAAIYLYQQHRGAFIELLVIDADNNMPIYTWRNETSRGWIGITLQITQTIRNAMIEIRSNVNKNSMLAIEYLFVLNSEIISNECHLHPVEPTDSPNETTEGGNESTSDHPQETTTNNPEETTTNNPDNPEEGAESTDKDPWFIAAIAMGIFLVLVLLVLIFILLFKHSRSTDRCAAPH